MTDGHWPELFRMNEHGDIWQEPTLFDQGGEVPPQPDTSSIEDHRRHVAENLSLDLDAPGDPEWSAGIIRANDHGCHFCPGHVCEIPNCSRNTN